MPAYRQRVYIYPEQDGAPCLAGEFPLWWRRVEFFETYGSRQIEIETLVDINYALLLTGGEARAWDARCRASFADGPSSGKPFIVQAMQEWDEMLAQARWVVVESYEWESGLD
jgi:hypothetical protein